MAVEAKVHESQNGEASILEPEVLAKAKDVEVDPVVREQALPEKQDDRFMDRWTLDWARDLGERVVRRLGLQRLQEGTEGFAEWRALGHEVRRLQQDSDDEVAIAITDDEIEKEAEWAEIYEARGTVAKDVADGYKEEATKAEEARMAILPALRGSRPDVGLLIVASVILFAVDILILHQALGLLTGADWEHWGTAALLGAGIVVVGEIVGWALAAAMVRDRGRFEAPAEKVAIAIALLVLLTILFFVALGVFRADSLQKLAKIDKLQIPSPKFFTLAQILFFIGSAASCFSFIARSDGRVLLERFKQATQDEKEQRKVAAAWQEEAERAKKAAGEAPIRRRAAEARLASRQAVAAAQAKRDRQQAEYLKPLLEMEYLARRAEVESGLRYWTLTRVRQVVVRLRSLTWLLHPGLTFAVLIAGVAFAAMNSISIAVTAGLAVLLAIWLGRLVSKGGEHPDRASEPEIVERDYVAQVRPGPLPEESPKATEIERLVRREQQDRNGDSGPRQDHNPDHQGL